MVRNNHGIKSSLALACCMTSLVALADVTIQENSTGFCRYDGVIATAQSGFTGTGYVDIDNAGGKGISYVVNVPASGTYRVNFRYANTGSTSSSLVVNGSSGSLSFPRTASLSTWNTAGKNINLRAGANTLRLQASGSQAIANIDALTVEGNASAGNCSGGSISSASSSSVVASSSSVAVSSSSSLSSSAISSSSRSSVAVSSSSSSTSSIGGIANCPIQPNPSETVQLNATVEIGVGEIFDGANRRYNLSGGSQSEGQPPVFRLQHDAVIRNVVIGNLASDGIHCEGSCTIENVWWEDIGEDAATARGPAGTLMRINCGGAFLGDDKIFQHNGRGAVHISNFIAENAGKLYRSCGDCTGNGGPRYVTIDNVRTSDVDTIAGINKNFGDVVVMRNVIIHHPSTHKVKACQVYRGVVKGQGSTSALGVEFETENCDVKPSDISLVGATRLNLDGYTGSDQPNVIP
jgi:hypothetical protein